MLFPFGICVGIFFNLFLNSFGKIIIIKHTAAGISPTIDKPAVASLSRL